MAKEKREPSSYFVRIENWHPTKLNQLMNSHWAKRGRLRKHDDNIVAMSVLGADVPKAEQRRRVSLEIYLAERQRGGDVDAYWKSTLDALVNCGALVDDNPEWVELGEVKFYRAQRPATLIILENMMARSAKDEPTHASQRAGKHSFRLVE